MVRTIKADCAVSARKPAPRYNWPLNAVALIVLVVALGLMYQADVTKTLVYNRVCRPMGATGYEVEQPSLRILFEFLMPGVPLILLRSGKRLYFPLTLVGLFLIACGFYLNKAQHPIGCFSGQRDGHEGHELMGFEAALSYIMLLLTAWCGFFVDLSARLVGWFRRKRTARSE